MSRRILGKKLLGITFFTIASFFVSANLVACGNDDEAVPQMQSQVQAPRSVAIVNVEKFTAPASSEITADKAKLYARASAALVELGFRWSERIDKAQSDEKIQILNAYNAARDQACARVGLNGIAEYDWITSVAIPDPKNKAVFESVGVKTAN